MKIASVKEVKNRLSHFLKTAEKEDVVITKNGKPSAIIHHLGEDEIEDYLLEHDRKFRAKIEKRWKDYLTKGGRSIEEILQSLDNTLLSRIDHAIQSKDSDQFVTAYKETIEGCYSCHKASGKPFLRPQIPTTPPQPILNYDPAAKWPE